MQHKTVLTINGLSLVIAITDSRKTRVMTYVIVYLLNKDITPNRILAFTFTKKDARGMKERMGKLVGQKRARYL